MFNKALFPAKLILFCWFGCNACLVPYMTIHMRQLGLSVAETAFIYTFLPVSQLLCQPVAGLIADKLGKYKLVLLLCFFLTLAMAFAIQLVPSSIKNLDHNVYLDCKHDTKPGLIFPDFCGDVDCDLGFNNLEVTLRDCECEGTSSEVCFTGNFEQRTFCLNKSQPLVVNLYLSNSGRDCKVAALRLIKNQQILHDLSCPSPCRCTVNPSHPTPVCDLKPESNHSLTFWLYFIFRLAFKLFNGICFGILDATLIIVGKAQNTDYGKLRVFAVLGAGIFSPVTGFLIDYVSVDSSNDYQTNYAPAFYGFYVLILFTILFTCILDLEVCPPPTDVWKKVSSLLKTTKVLIFLAVIMVLGTCWGFVENFLFWYLLDLNAPKYLLGLTLTVGAVVGLPFLQYSQWFVDRMGRVNLLILALLFYLFRFVGYSLIYNPWWCIPFEAMEVFTYHLMWVAAATYCAKLAPQGLLATFQGTLGALHYGVGRGTGSFLGGTFLALLGARLAFRIMGIIAGVTALIYALVHYVPRMYDKTREKDAKDKTTVPLDAKINLNNDKIML